MSPSRGETSPSETANCQWHETANDGGVSIQGEKIMNQSDIRAMKKRLADRHDAEKAEPFWVSLVGAVFWMAFCLLWIFIPL